MDGLYYLHFIIINIFKLLSDINNLNQYNRVDHENVSKVHSILSMNIETKCVLEFVFFMCTLFRKEKNISITYANGGGLFFHDLLCIITYILCNLRSTLNRYTLLF